jgi:hypothetical protein
MTVGLGIGKKKGLLSFFVCLNNGHFLVVNTCGFATSDFKLLEFFRLMID